MYPSIVKKFVKDLVESKNHLKTIEIFVSVILLARRMCRCSSSVPMLCSSKRGERDFYIILAESLPTERILFCLIIASARVNTLRRRGGLFGNELSKRCDRE